MRNSYHTANADWHSAKGKVCSYRAHKTLYNLLPGWPIQSITISISLGRFQPCFN